MDAVDQAFNSITPVPASASSKIYKVSCENMRFLQQDQTLDRPSKVQAAFMIRKISFLSGLLMLFICWGKLWEVQTVWWIQLWRKSKEQSETRARNK